MPNNINTKLYHGEFTTEVLVVIFQMEQPPLAVKFYEQQVRYSYSPQAVAKWDVKISCAINMSHNSGKSAVNFSNRFKERVSSSKKCCEQRVDYI